MVKSLTEYTMWGRIKRLSYNRNISKPLTAHAKFNVHEKARLMEIHVVFFHLTSIMAKSTDGRKPRILFFRYKSDYLVNVDCQFLDFWSHSIFLTAALFSFKTVLFSDLSRWKEDNDKTGTRQWHKHEWANRWEIWRRCAGSLRCLRWWTENHLNL